MQQRIINILFGVIIVILTGTVVYLTFGNKSTPVAGITPTPVKTTIKAPVVATDETADWKTYTNTEFGYSFKYPSTYTIKTIGSEIQIYETPTTTDGQWIVSIYGSNVKEGRDTLKDFSLDTAVREMMDSQTLSESKPTTINGISAYEGISTGIVNQYGIFLDTDLHYFKILFNSTDKGNLQQDKAALTNVQKQILASFKFTDQTSDSAISNWKTYTNSNFGFEFKYPETWNTVESTVSGPDYKVIVRVVNPLWAGRQDTDVPTEQFLVRSQNIACEGQPIDLGGEIGTNKDWQQGFGLIYYRDLCFKTQDWPFTLSLSAHDELSQVTLDKILSTFKFTK